MAEERNVRPGYKVIYPNRGKAASKLVRLIVVLLLLASAVLMIIVTIGGWGKFQGMKPLNIIFILSYIGVAFYIWSRWSRGLLPLAALLAILVLMVVVVSTLGLGGTSWFNRDKAGFAPPESILGSSGLSAPILGTLTALLIPVEIALIVFSMIGFSQGWNVEQEVPEDEAKGREGHSDSESGSKGESDSKQSDSGGKQASGGAEPATA